MSGLIGETIHFRVNGIEREICPKQGMSLMRYLREELGLTGTKCGCQSGDCGTCKVLVDGQAVNSCTLALRKLEGWEVVTIEGLAPDATRPGSTLHPVQQAFIDAGAIQCGFCTPGMIITTVALLSRNPDPSSDEIRKALDGNLCRCTGYRKIVDAVLLAVRYMRGGVQNIEEGGRPAGPNTIALGIPSPVRDARKKVTGRLLYTGDLNVPGMLVGKILYAPAAHGLITSIDTSLAEALPGVRAVASFANSPDKPYNSHTTLPFQKVPKNERIFNRHFRFHGDRIAAVAAEDEATARKALGLIKIEWEPYPASLTIEDALAPGAKSIHEGGNLADTIREEGGTPSPKRGERYEGVFRLPRVTHAALERHISISDFDGERLTVYSSCQNVFCYRAMLGELFDLPLNRVRVIKPAVGGAFGGKSEMVSEPVSSLLALMTGRPVKVELSRKEVMCSTRTRTSGRIELSMEVDEDDRFISHDYHAYLDRGAYFGSAYDLGYALMDKAFRLYRVPRIDTSAALVYTNNQAAGAVRGYGNPQISFAREVLIDRICRQRGIDPLEFRIKNLVLPWDRNPANGYSLGNCRIIECLELGAGLCGWEEKRKRSDSGTIRRGIGLACGVHGSGIHPGSVDYSTAGLKMNGDGTARLSISAHENGQGSSVVMAKIAAEVLGIPETSISLVETDTETTWYDNGSYASRETWACGGAVKRAAESVKRQLTEEAAVMFGCTVGAVVAGAGYCRKRAGEADAILSYGDVIAYARSHYPYHDINAVESYASPMDPGSYFVNFAEVEVDMEKRTIKVLKVTVVHDCGTIINPMLIEGQVDGGMHMGLGYALCEELLSDRHTGKQLTTSFKQYKMISPEAMPEVELRFLGGQEPLGPFGAKGIGEATTVAIAPAVANAVTSATGIEISSLPIKI
ncbi:molybdopterin-dependent oxidoreductase [Sediminispirochaeta smaragdinae]|uniref:Aldehyde oxidase and xanthine dehydrogenase molybdopterin binding protein n=1 Tax=Sediminispirochaeta smaragdinae (strain DSM 11293 / JCM 15392 / SEBR 4228) TaxID=573413 RepID=E1R0U3_SEDSS|nr:molybdopterin cofactor-binding domain-containing protein [Sediminispirochaeta smaragdinae]ADK80192.1 aldehyde oxidase and xanthine dehydrogenase molybdopterin binding protein [Sediminispirochaeta smaragdinae DSM 11293]